MVLRFNSYFRAELLICFVIGGHAVWDVPLPSGWFHLVINIIKPNDEQGLEIHFDGVQLGINAGFGANRTIDGSERVVIGNLRNSPGVSGYASVQMDELMFFNKALNQEEITELRQWSQ